MQAYFEGQMQVSDFARTGEDRPTPPHNVFDKTLPVIDIGAIKDGNKQEREAMLEAAKSWGFFRITNHGVPLIGSGEASRDEWEVVFRAADGEETSGARA